MKTTSASANKLNALLHDSLILRISRKPDNSNFAIPSHEAQQRTRPTPRFAQKQIDERAILANLRNNSSDFQQEVEIRRRKLSTKCIHAIRSRNILSGSWHGTPCFFFPGAKRSMYLSALAPKTNCEINSHSVTNRELSAQRKKSYGFTKINKNAVLKSGTKMRTTCLEHY